MSEIKGPSASNEDFGVTKETLKRAETINSQLESVALNPKDFGTDFQNIEEQDKKALERTRRFLRMAELKEWGGKEQEHADSVRTAYKISRDARQPVASERKVVQERTELVNNFLIEEGQTPRFDPEEMLDRVLVYPDESRLATGERFKAGGSELVGVKRSVLRKPKEHTILDHEMIHLYQSLGCPKGLAEGITASYQRVIARRNGEKTPKDAYGLDVLLVSILEKTAGKEAIAETYFSGDARNLFKAFEQKNSLDKLKQTLADFENGQAILKKLSQNNSLWRPFVDYPRAYVHKMRGLLRLWSATR